MLKIKFKGEYVIGRGPCEWLPDGSRRWARTTGFKIIKLIKGDLKVTYVEISSYDEKNHSLNQFEVRHEYFITINLSKERFQELELNKANTIMTYRNSIRNNEIVKIEKKLK